MVEGKETPKLTPASENIWYALATIAWGMKKLGFDVQENNRYYWNGLMRQYLSDEKIAGLEDKDGNTITLPDLTEEDIADIRTVLDRTGFEGQNIPNAIAIFDFSRLEFSKQTQFEKFIFPRYASFSFSTFIKGANFKGAIFFDRVDFEETTFKGWAFFDEARYKKDAVFSGAKFFSPVSFKGTKFSGFVDFCGSVFSSRTDCTSAVFSKHPPAFYDAKVSEDIRWEDAIFPKAKNVGTNSEKNELAVTLYDASRHKNAYERLALMMSKLEKTHDKHMFFRYEMRVRRRLESSWVSKSMNWFYDKSCHYGYDFGRALAWWFGHIVLGACLLFIPTPHNWAGFVNSVATSFANAHSFLGLSRGPLKTVYADYAKWDLFNVIWTVQGLFGIMFLFFLILTIRNQFKMG